MSKNTSGEARVLVDLPHYGAKSGDLLIAAQSEIKALGGQVDPSPEAVDYAKTSGAKVVDSTKAAEAK